MRYHAVGTDKCPCEYLLQPLYFELIAHVTCMLNMESPVLQKGAQLICTHVYSIRNVIDAIEVLQFMIVSIDTFPTR